MEHFLQVGRPKQSLNSSLKAVRKAQEGTDEGQGGENQHRVKKERITVNEDT